MPSRQQTITREEFENLALTVAQLVKQVEADRQMRKEIHAKVMELHRGLLEPEPGHEQGLLHRMAAVTIAAETGKAAGEWFIWWAKVAAAVGVILSSFYAAIRFGHLGGKQ